LPRLFLAWIVAWSALALCTTRLNAGPSGIESFYTESICRQLEEIRGLSFRSNVAVAVQAREAFAAYVAESIEIEYGEDRGEGYVSALVKLGALEEPVDLTDTVLSLLENQAAAHYDPRPGHKAYYLLATNAPSFALDMISSHELCHALQDQNFDLHALTRGSIKSIRDNGDRGWALQSLVEGDATLVMTIWAALRQMGAENDRWAKSLASLSLGVQAGLTFEQLVQLSAVSAELDPSLQGLSMSSEELESAPRFFVQMLFASYFQGAVMVDRVRKEEGWPAVDRLYASPPASTEQVLHPEKLTGQRDEPVVIRLDDAFESLGPAWRLADEDVLGELGVRTMLDVWLSGGTGEDRASSHAAAGWGGDRYCYWRNSENGKDLLVWRTAWDTEADAAQFMVGYRSVLPVRFPELRKVRRSAPGSDRQYQIWEVEPGRLLKLARRGKDVGIIDTTDKALPGMLWE